MSAYVHELAQHTGYENIELAEALKVYDESPKEMRQRYCRWEKGDMPAPHIFHDGKWKNICRTDDKDNVATGYDTREDRLESSIARYRERIRYGARFTDRLFACIDAYSDG